jgi:hypothetical protein
MAILASTRIRQTGEFLASTRIRQIRRRVAIAYLGALHGNLIGSALLLCLSAFLPFRNYYKLVTLKKQKIILKKF